MHKLKVPAIITIILATSFFIGKKIFKYYSHTEKPQIFIKNFKNGDTYKDTATWAISANNDYKIDTVSMQLDGQPFDFGASQKVRAQSFEIPLTLDTTTMTSGKHTLDITSIDASAHKNTSNDHYEFFVDNAPLKAAFLQTSYKVDQGKTMHVKIQANKQLQKATLSFFTKNYECAPESTTSTVYECFIPVDCEDSTGESMITAQLEDAVHNSVTLNAQGQIVKFPFKKQASPLNVSTKKLDEEKEISMNSKILKTAIAKWVESSPKQKLWAGAFEYPTEYTRIATPHGEIRITPERGMYYHHGIDLVNHPKQVIWASQTGKVIIKDRFLLTGNTIVLDHGLGVCSLYAHLNDFADIEVGDMVKKGNSVGTIGMTGYATGYHLHWEIIVNNISVDPIEWTQTVY